MMKMRNMIFALLTVAALGLSACGGSGGSATPGNFDQPIQSIGAPTAPSGVSATGGDQSMHISWSAVSGATSYAVYWSSTNGVTPATGTKIANISSTTYHHDGLGANKTYYYIVTALNAAGESSVSNQASAATNATAVQSAPAKPAGVTAASGANRVTITWNPVSGATSYNIYWSNDPAHVMKEHGAKQIYNVSSPYHHTALTAATTYAYAVTAVNSAGESGESGVASATTAATDSPGVVLYATYCASCHNPLAISNKKGRSAAQTQSAIADNRGGMGSLSMLTTAQLQAIADVLGY